MRPKHSSTSFRSAPALCALLALAVLLTACGSPAAPAAETQPPASASPAPTSDPLPSETPPPSPTPEPARDAPVTCGPGVLAPLAFLPDGSGLLGWVDAGILLWDLETGEALPFIEVLEVTAAALSPDGSTLALATADNTIRLYRTADRGLIHTLAGHLGRVTGLVFSPDGVRLFSASHDGFVTEWDVLSRAQLHTFQPGGSAPAEVVALALSPDGSRLATMGSEGLMRVWSLPEYGPASEFAVENGAIDEARVAFSPDGGRVALAPGSGPVTVWDLATGERLWSGGETAFAFSPDGGYLVVANRDAAGSPLIELRSPDGAELVRALGPQAGPVHRIVISSDGRLLAAADDRETQLWPAADGGLERVWDSACP